MIWLDYIFFLLLAIATLLAWTVSYKKTGLYVFLLSIIIGIAQSYITLQGLLVIAVLGIIHYLLQSRSNSSFFRVILHGMLISLFVGCNYHLLPGFL
jgi:hypothetical protein